jgi:hypothetical protein
MNRSARVIAALCLALSIPSLAIAGSISGGVRERNTNTPISGATVRLEQNGQIKYTTTTNSTGNYSLSSIPNGTYNLVCLKLNCYQNWGPSPRTLGTLTNQNIVMEKFASLSGTVTNSATGGAIGGATARIQQNNVVLYTAVTDGSGNYNFSCIPAGSYTLDCLKLGQYINWGPQGITLNLNDVIGGHNIAMVPLCSVSGVIRDKWTGAGIGGATARLEQNGQILYSVYADGSGQYSLTQIPNGNYNLVGLKLEAYQNYLVPITLNAGDNQARDIPMCPLTARIAGAVSDASTGAAIGGATVRLEAGGHILYVTTADGGGNYAFTDVSPGSYNLVGLKLDRYLNWIQARQLNACDNITNANIAMTPYPNMSGIVHERDCSGGWGTGIGGALVTLTGPVNGQAYTNSGGGDWQFSFLPPGTYHVHIDPPANFSIPPTPDQDRDVTMGTANSTGHNAEVHSYHVIRGRSTSFETGAPVAGDKITYGDLCGPVSGQVVTDDNGYYATPPIPQGSYSLGAGSCDDIAYLCPGNPIVLGCSGDQTADFRQKGLVIPASVSATPGVDGHSITVSWGGGDSNTATYNILGADAPGGPYSPIGQSMPPFTEYGLHCGQTRSYEIAAANSCGRQGQESSPVSVAILACLTPPILASPVGGLSIKLPETFSWNPVPGAATYDVQLSSTPGFEVINWSTNTALPNVAVPLGAAPITGSTYYWRVRAQGAFTSDWSTDTFRTIEVPILPAQVVLSSPHNGDVLAGSSVLLQWEQAQGATSYRVEVSSGVDFGNGASTTNVLDGITTLYITVPIGPDISALYWRVTGNNAAGFGTPSESGQFFLSPSAAGVAGVAITAPATDVTVVKDGVLRLTGLVVGHVDGAANLNWLLDGSVVGAESLVLSGVGGDTDPVAVAFPDLGPHTLQLVTADGSVTSPTRTITVVAPTFGPPASLSGESGEAVMAAGDTTAIYCSVRDASGQIVLNDTGRLIHFRIVAGDGQLSTADEVDANGTAVAIYRSATTDSNVTVEVSDASTSAHLTAGLRREAMTALPPAQLVIAAYAPLAQQKQIAYAFLDLIRNPTIPIIDGRDNTPTTLDSIPVASARAFVTNATDARAVFRLNLFLRLVHRALYYGSKTPAYPGPHELAAVPGMATLIEDQAGAIGRQYSITVALGYGAIVKSWGCLGNLPPVAQRVQRYEDYFASNYNKALLNPPFSMSQGSRALLTSGLAPIKSSVRSEMQAEHLVHIGANVLNVLDPAWVGRYKIESDASRQLGNLTYVPTVRRELNRLVAFLGVPRTNWGTDQAAETAINSALSNIRSIAASRDAEFIGAKNLYSGWIQSLAACIPGPGVFVGLAQNLLQSDALLGAGVKCGDGAYLCSGEIKKGVDGLISGAAGPVATRSAGKLAPARLVPNAARMGANPRVAALASGTSETAANYEQVGRKVEFDLSNGDVASAQADVAALDSAASQLADFDECALSPLLAVKESARLDISAYRETIDSVLTVIAAASEARSQARWGAGAWIEDVESDSLRQGALDLVRSAIDLSKAEAATAGSVTSKILGELAVSYLALGTPASIRMPTWGDTVTVVVPVVNLGGVLAPDAHVVLSVPPAELEIVGDSVASIGDIAPGGVASAIWVVRTIGVPSDSDSVAVIPIAVNPDSASAPGSIRASALIVPFNRAVVGVSPGAKFAFAIDPPFPNPSQGSTRIGFTLSERGDVVLTVIDVAGRSVWRQRLAGAVPGAHSVTWDGRTLAGRQAAAGVYFVRLSAGTRVRAARLVLLR